MYILYIIPPNVIAVRKYIGNVYACICIYVIHIRIEDYCVAWRKGIRRILGLPRDSHSLLLPVLSNVVPMMDEVCLCQLVLFRNVYQVTVVYCGLLPGMVYLAEWLQLLVEMCYFIVSAMVSLFMKYYEGMPSSMYQGQ